MTIQPAPRIAPLAPPYHLARMRASGLPEVDELEEHARRAGVSVRGGCFCNPGTGETAEHITEDDILAALDQSHDFDQSHGRIMLAHDLSPGRADVFRAIEIFVD